jgi:hypothetical protein
VKLAQAKTPYLKKYTTKKGLTECLPSKCEALSSNPTTTKKKKKKKID